MSRAPRAGSLLLDPRWPDLRARLESTTQQELPLARLALEASKAALVSGRTPVTAERLRTAIKRSGAQRKLPEDLAAPVRVSFVCARAHAQCGRTFLLPGYTYVVEPL